MLLFFYSYLILSVVHFSMLLGERLLLLMSFVFSKELSDFFFFFLKVVVHSMASRCQCFSICGDCKEVEVQQRLLHCLNQGTGSGSTALLAVIPSSSLPPYPAHSLSRPPWRARKASSPVPASCKNSSQDSLRSSALQVDFKISFPRLETHVRVNTRAYLEKG